MRLRIEQGRDIRKRHVIETDVAVVGSGPGGATVAMKLAEYGLRVTIIEAGRYFSPDEYPEGAFEAMTRMYRDAGAQVTRGLPSIPLLQGKAVGGTSVMNGAICWRLPHDIWEEWTDEDPQLGEVLSWERVEAAHDEVERDLGIAPTDPAIAGRNNDLLAKGADELGLEHRPIRRNVTSCAGLGRCLQGCPERRKASMDQSYLPRACEAGAQILSECRAQRIVTRRGRAVAVVARSSGGARVEVLVRHGVVVAASAIQTPALLLRSGLRGGPVGENFQAHPGVSVSGRFADAVQVWKGATQGHEVIGLRKDGIKFEALGFGRAVAISRADGVGRKLRRNIAQIDRFAHWGAAIRASAIGRVRITPFGTSVDYRLEPDDMLKVRRGVGVLGELMFAAGADLISPKVHGWNATERSLSDWRQFTDAGPLGAASYTPVMTHMFGTARMGSDRRTSVVGTRFEHHRIAGLWVSDSSVFPSNTGVNPQVSICALAMLCADEIVAQRLATSAPRGIVEQPAIAEEQTGRSPG